MDHEPDTTSGNGTELEVEPLGQKPDPSTSPKMLVPLFLVPGVIVAVILVVFLGFGAIVGGPDTLEALIERIESGGANDRWQAAAALTHRVEKEPELRKDEALRRRLRQAFTATAANRYREREYLARLFAVLKDTESATLLKSALLDDLKLESEAPEGAQPPEDLRWCNLAYVEALGMIGNRSVLPTVVMLATHKDVSFRKRSATAIGDLLHPHVDGGKPAPAPAMAALERLHDDDNPWVRMNAALSLAKAGSGTGLATLEIMLTQEFYERSGMEDLRGVPRFMAFSLVMIERVARLDPDSVSEAGDALLSAVEGVATTANDTEVEKLARRVLGVLRG